MLGAIDKWLRVTVVQDPCTEGLNRLGAYFSRIASWDAQADASSDGTKPDRVPRMETSTNVMPSLHATLDSRDQLKHGM